ncbi:YybH family protein [Taibaiella soli]|uniref:DUF4440 domain-containing protein n=1 Tax=Taibaiella soli TaxID=1649169 RepID=A0A2W2C2G6_9BACT|nr:DUF4440 domain-containing protein [Taibaiella soli]PZF74283.1 hypothetical protein DN068_04550 [Taibaiella soli]
MKYSILIFTLLLTACGRDNIRFEAREDIDSIIAADKEMSKTSEQQGFNKSMLTSLSDSAVLLRPDHAPLKSASLQTFLNDGADSNYVVTWEPSNGSVAVSGEMGYTYGIYTARNKKDGSVMKGTYTTIWVRAPKGKWKLVLNSGNPGIQ